MTLLILVPCWVIMVQGIPSAIPSSSHLTLAEVETHPLLSSEIVNTGIPALYASSLQENLKSIAASMAADEMYHTDALVLAVHHYERNLEGVRLRYPDGPESHVLDVQAYSKLIVATSTYGAPSINAIHASETSLLSYSNIYGENDGFLYVGNFFDQETFQRVRTAYYILHTHPL
jgi:hypothetical protein